MKAEIAEQKKSVHLIKGQVLEEGIKQVKFAEDVLEDSKEDFVKKVRNIEGKYHKQKTISEFSFSASHICKENQGKLGFLKNFYGDFCSFF